MQKLANLYLNSSNLSRVSNPPKPVSIEGRLKSWNIKYNFKWNQPYLSRVSNLSRDTNSLNSASGTCNWTAYPCAVGFKFESTPLNFNFSSLNLNQQKVVQRSGLNLLKIKILERIRIMKKKSQESQDLENKGLNWKGWKMCWMEIQEFNYQISLEENTSLVVQEEIKLY